MPKISYYNIDYQDVLNKLGSDREKGLSKNEVSKRQQQFGSNEIADDRPKHLVLKILWNQFNNLLVLILAISAIITYFLGNKLDTYVIIFAILSDAIIGFVQEYRANKAIESLKEVGVWILGLEAGQGSRSIEQVDLTIPLAWVVGNEGEGMRALVRKSCDLLVSLPMTGKVDSFNAAVAGSMALFHTVMLRRMKAV